LIVVDTSVWIEFFKGNSSIYTDLKLLLEKNEILACELVFGELLQGAKNKRERDIISNYWLNLPEFTMDGSFISAGLQSGKNNWLNKGVGLIDCSILMYARVRACKLWTFDKKLLSILQYDEKYI
jgi:predicted nucleic acid-binding protein